MGAPARVVPYEKQSDAETNRGCGAACLSMVYRSFGKEIKQAEIWPAISKPNRFGSVSSTTHMMAQDAINRGFKAVAMQARHPLQALRLCRESGTCAILNQRLKIDGRAGHYTVLVDMDDKSVTLHDPFLGPSRRLLHAELLDLWQPGFPDSEIVGNMMVAIDLPVEDPAPATKCWLCQSQFPPAVECPRCRKPVGLQPNAVLGCINLNCIARMWNYLCCPTCDYTWSFTLGESESKGPASPEGAGAAAKGSFDVDAVCAAVDKLRAFVLGIPAAANNSLVLQQLDYMAATKDKLRLSRAEDLANRKIRMDQIAVLAQSCKEKEEAHRKRMEELNTPSAPLDGNALGRALMKNLGFISSS